MDRMFSVSGDLSAGKRNRPEMSLEKRVLLKLNKKCGHCHLLRKMNIINKHLKAHFCQTTLTET